MRGHDVGSRLMEQPEQSLSTERQRLYVRTALASRDVIGQAKGILMERFGISAAAAFAMLRRLSQESNTKLVHIAEKIIRLEQPDEAGCEPSRQWRKVSCGERV